MEKFGPVTLVTLPKKDDGKLKGFGFVVFDYLNDAKKAIESLNARKDKFMGTKIACDWCIPKNLFIKNTEETKIDKENVEKEKKRKNTSDGESDEDADDDENECNLNGKNNFNNPRGVQREILVRFELLTPW